MLVDGYTTVQILHRFEKAGVTKYDVANVRHGRVATTYKPRADKGTKKIRGGTASVAESSKPVTSGKSVTELLSEGVLQALEKMRIQENIDPATRLKSLNDAARVERHIKATEIDAYLKRDDAGVIAALVRIFEPEATDSDVVKYYLQAGEIYKAELHDIQ